MGRRGKRGTGNPDGTPRLDLGEAEVEFAPFSTEDASFQPAGQEGKSDAEVLNEFLQASDRPSEPASFVTEQAEHAEPGPAEFYSEKKSPKLAEQDAAYFLMILEGAAVLGFGEDARLLTGERKRIVDPMSRIMARMDPQVTGAVRKYTDPVLLLFGMLAWGGRLYAIAKERSEDDDEPRKPRPPAPEPRPPEGRENGRTVHEVLADEDAILRAGPDRRMTEQFQSGHGMIQ